MVQEPIAFSSLAKIISHNIVKLTNLNKSYHPHNPRTTRKSNLQEIFMLFFLTKVYLLLFTCNISTQPLNSLRNNIISITTQLTFLCSFCSYFLLVQHHEIPSIIPMTLYMSEDFDFHELRTEASKSVLESNLISPVCCLWDPE